MRNECGWQVQTLEQEVQTLSKDLTKTNVRSAAPRVTTQGLHGMQKRIAWARQAMQRPQQGQQLALKRGLVHEIDVASPFYSTSRGDPMGTALSTEAGDDNWVNALAPGDYWKDPYVFFSTDFVFPLFLFFPPLPVKCFFESTLP